jgi:ABC-2 type transport system ATP-binding protein
MDELFECKQLAKRFGATRALDKIDLSIQSGSTIGLIGPNGAGKTTLFSILCGHLRPTSGTVTVLGKPADSSAIKGRISLLPQDASLFKGISVSSQLALFAKLQGFNSKEANMESMRVLESLEIVDLGRHPPDALSFGQRKRVMIAQALVGKPELILLDEPTSGLDPVAATEVRRLVQQLCKERNFIISSHNLDEIEDICKSVIILNKGKVMANCLISEFTDRDNYLTITLDQPIPSDAANLFGDMQEIKRINIDPLTQEQMSIYFKSKSPDQLQIRILERLQEKNLRVLDLSRGKALADEIINLVKGEKKQN